VKRKLVRWNSFLQPVEAVCFVYCSILDIYGNALNGPGPAPAGIRLHPPAGTQAPFITPTGVYGAYPEKIEPVGISAIQVDNSFPPDCPRHGYPGREVHAGYKAGNINDM